MSLDIPRTEGQSETQLVAQSAGGPCFTGTDARAGLAPDTLRLSLNGEIDDRRRAAGSASRPGRRRSCSGPAGCDHLSGCGSFGTSRGPAACRSAHHGRGRAIALVLDGGAQLSRSRGLRVVPDIGRLGGWIHRDFHHARQPGQSTLEPAGVAGAAEVEDRDPNPTLIHAHSLLRATEGCLRTD